MNLKLKCTWCLIAIMIYFNIRYLFFNVNCPKNCALEAITNLEVCGQSLYRNQPIKISEHFQHQNIMESNRRFKRQLFHKGGTTIISKKVFKGRNISKNAEILKPENIRISEPKALAKHKERKYEYGKIRNAPREKESDKSNKRHYTKTITRTMENFHKNVTALLEKTTTEATEDIFQILKNSNANALKMNILVFGTTEFGRIFFHHYLVK